jgi:hypothetical protein
MSLSGIVLLRARPDSYLRNQNLCEFKSARGSSGSAHLTLSWFRKLFHKLGYWKPPQQLLRFVSWSPLLVHRQPRADISLFHLAWKCPWWRLCSDDGTSVVERLGTNNVHASAIKWYNWRGRRNSWSFYFALVKRTLPVVCFAPNCPSGLAWYIALQWGLRKAHGGHVRFCYLALYLFYSTSPQCTFWAAMKPFSPSRVCTTSVLPGGLCFPLVSRIMRGFTHRGIQSHHGTHHSTLVEARTLVDGCY